MTHCIAHIYLLQLLAQSLGREAHLGRVFARGCVLEDEAQPVSRRCK